MKNEIAVAGLLFVLGIIFVNGAIEKEEVNFKEDLVKNNDSVGWLDNPNDSYWDSPPYITAQSFKSKTNQSYANITVEYKFYDYYGKYMGGENVTVDFSEEGDIVALSSIKLSHRPSSFTAELISATPIDE